MGVKDWWMGLACHLAPPTFMFFILPAWVVGINWDVAANRLRESGSLFFFFFYVFVSKEQGCGPSVLQDECSHNYVSDNGHLSDKHASIAASFQQFVSEFKPDQTFKVPSACRLYKTCHAVKNLARATTICRPFSPCNNPYWPFHWHPQYHKQQSSIRALIKC